MRRLGVALLLALPLLNGLAADALAGPAWCIVDPVLSVDGHSLRLATWLQAHDAGELTGPVQYTISVPSDVARVAVRHASGAVPEQVTVQRTLAPSAGGPLTVQVTVTVTAATTFVTKTVAMGAVEKRVTVLGVTNSPTTFDLTLGR